MGSRTWRGVQLVKHTGPKRPKTWKIIAVDEDPDGETVGEFVVAAADRPAARAAFLAYGLSGMTGPPENMNKPLDLAMEQPGVVFTLDYRSNVWSPVPEGGY
jgi:hypothetical protein